MSALAQRLLPKDELERLRALAFHDEGHGYDAFGLHPAWVGVVLALLRPLHQRWFRVSAHGIENIPREGAAVLVANHSGVLPFDGAMVCIDVLRRMTPPRVVRPVADVFVPKLPFVSTLFARGGVVAGTRGNARALLDQGELLLIFPEGTAGIGKPFRDRYHLQRWTVGHAELALRHRAPVVPVGIVGAEEQFPFVVRLPIHALGVPYLPLSPLPFPLPVHYHLLYGEPIALHQRFRPEDADDPDAVRAAAEIVKAAVERLIAEGRAARKGIFR
jgi:1-acyl-sn-glycerol-3-phosphate acyltransferase